MLPLLLTMLLAQVGCLGEETSAVCYCKQGVASACEAVRVVNPKLAKVLEKEAARRAAEEAAARAAKRALEQAAALESAAQAMESQESNGQQVAEEANSEAQDSSSSPEPPECKGQLHHIISRPIAKALEEHRTLRGLYKPRDERFITRGKDEQAHCGYQDWHRKVDEEVIRWLKNTPEATPAQFLQKLREIYSRPELQARFPHGF